MYRFTHLLLLAIAVSWIRVSDLHILTVAQYTYTADDRFEVIHSPDSNSQSWVLKINSVQPRDSGRYECQVKHSPPPTPSPSQSTSPSLGGGVLRAAGGGGGVEEVC
ncbi:hypothetical protein Pmani_038824 [Petrolisthes manimaculis]|uniref:Ig-like domain-containing protein n=1 Tax=Petrolisthes manimaculis TaxID=1843537 RepID=A0AAE1NDW8_9EUCA|nr:hypothetical protein Pmani_038824 [Petrolisthes manimaculis]